MNSYGMVNTGNLMNNMVHHHGTGSNSQQLNSSKFKRWKKIEERSKSINKIISVSNKKINQVHRL